MQELLRRDGKSRSRQEDGSVHQLRAWRDWPIAPTTPIAPGARNHHRTHESLPSCGGRVSCLRVSHPAPRLPPLAPTTNLTPGFYVGRELCIAAQQQRAQEARAGDVCLPLVRLAASGRAGAGAHDGEMRVRGGVRRSKARLQAQGLLPRRHHQPASAAVDPAELRRGRLL